MALTEVPIELSSAPGIVDNSTGTAITIDASSNVGIGETNPIVPLHVLDETGATSLLGNVAATFRTASVSHPVNIQLSDGVANAANIGMTAGDLFFATASTERMRIDASGNVGIGTSSPSSFFSGASQLVVGSGSGAQGITIYSASNDNAQIFFADGTTGDEAYRGILRYIHNDDAMAFYTGGASERLRIANTGQLLVGSGTSPASGEVKQTLVRGGSSYLEFQNTSTNTGSTIGTSGENLIVYTNSGALGSEVYTERMRIDSSGIDVTGTAVTDGLTVAGNVSVDSGTIKLDGNYPTGTGNVALGDTALDSLVSSNFNVAIGHLAATAFSSNNGYSVFVGAYAGQNTTTGDYNTVVGSAAFNDNTEGSNNTVLGTSALGDNTTASNNTAVGFEALRLNNTGTQNTAVGGIAGDAITTSSYNTLVGYNAGGASDADFNAFFGRSSGSAVTTGAKNTIIGSYNGNQNSLDIRTSSNNIVLSDGDGFPRQYYRAANATWANYVSEGIGRLSGPIDDQIAVANGATLTLTSATTGACSIYVYETTSGEGAQYFVTYNGQPIIVAANDSANFATTDSAGDYCIFKSNNSHTVTFKNNIGSSKNFIFLIVGSVAYA